jgi:hypothetical protein
MPGRSATLPPSPSLYVFGLQVKILGCLGLDDGGAMRRNLIGGELSWIFGITRSRSGVLGQKPISRNNYCFRDIGKTKSRDKVELETWSKKMEMIWDGCRQSVNDHTTRS